MRKKTLNTLLNHYTEAFNNNKTLNAYTKENNLSCSYFSSRIANMKDLVNTLPEGSKLNKIKECLRLHELLTTKSVDKVKSSPTKVDKISSITSNVVKTPDLFKYEYELPNGKIGYVSEEMMDKICMSYTRDGLNMTKSELCKFFVEFTEMELGAILRYFNITKRSLPFSPNVIADSTPEELAYKMSERKSKMVPSQVDKIKIREMEKEIQTRSSYEHSQAILTDTLIKLNNENTGLKNIKRINHTLNKINNGRTLILNLADWHIGARMDSNPLYDKKWDEETLYQSLNHILNQISDLDYMFEETVIHILGDMMDGTNGHTTRGTELPQNMDGDEQIRVYTESIEWFVNELRLMGISSKVSLYSVKCGNHDGLIASPVTQNIFYRLEKRFGDFINKTHIYNKAFGIHSISGHNFIIMHGKDEKHQKFGFPLILNPKVESFIDKFLINEGIASGSNYIIKGDLHQYAFQETSQFHYLNCPSLFGSSDHSQMNYTPTITGISYMIVDEVNVIQGVFKHNI